jgi:hypothetical protein
MDKAQVKQYLTEDDEGKALLEELKRPLLDKRDELLAETKRLREASSAAEQRAVAAETEIQRRDDDTRRAALDAAWHDVMERNGVVENLRGAFRALMEQRFEITTELADGDAQITVTSPDTGDPVEFGEFWDSQLAVERVRRDGDHETAAFLRNGNTGGGAGGPIGHSRPISADDGTQQFAEAVKQNMM